ncbi:hypothetical protein PISL3812_04304 [Talaromyces islandicus]|uniref:Nucleoside phosphorylase domain-containing protein n=1 Tax=Talaromyces islandicus TaxID=28573 RepID=A0A0U1LV57_TALIS|nr:hypothetical protein PISL3812_04304 [Talaromyces islandicus]
MSSGSWSNHGAGRSLNTGSTTLVEELHSPRFTVAIVCTLPLEYDALAAILHSRPQILPHADDRFIYTTGVFAGREVVIACPGDYGPRDAALAVQLLEQKYGKMKLIILLGICAGTPRPPEKEKPIYLGDVIISTAMLAYAHGAPMFFRGLELREVFPEKAQGKLRQVLHLLATEYFSEDLAEQSRQKLRELSSTKARYRLLREDEDLFFDPSYHHIHRSHCPAKICDVPTTGICKSAQETSCQELQCDTTYLARRRPPYEKTPLGIHSGVFASADMVMRDAQVRDELARTHKVLAFDMEAAGVWDLSPHVVVIKGVSDYGDSHKTKQWQDIAAAHAACTANVFIETFFPTGADEY